MSNAYSMTKDDLLRLFPEALARDESAAALGDAAVELLAELAEQSDALEIYNRIDELPEALLDILARDLKVDWYSGDYTLEEKGATVKSSFQVHKQMGTKTGVETALRAIYPDTEILLWWEYGGEPYHFRLLIDATAEGVDEAKHSAVMERLEFYKSLRDVLDEIEYRDAGTSAAAFAAAAVMGEALTDGAMAG